MPSRRALFNDLLASDALDAAELVEPDISQIGSAAIQNPASPLVPG
jgi:hypothetical protein